MINKRRLTLTMVFLTMLVWSLNTIKYHNSPVALLTLLFSFIAFKLAMMHYPKSRLTLQEMLKQTQSVKGRWD